MPRGLQFNLSALLSIVGFVGILIAVFVTESLNPRQRWGAIATGLLIGAIEFVKWIKKK